MGCECALDLLELGMIGCAKARFAHLVLAGYPIAPFRGIAIAEGYYPADRGRNLRFPGGHTRKGPNRQWVSKSAFSMGCLNKRSGKYSKFGENQKVQIEWGDTRLIEKSQIYGNRTV